MKPIVLLLSFMALALVAAGLTDVAFAQEEGSGGVSDGSKLLVQVLHLELQQVALVLV